MKICITSTGNDLEAGVDARFGRCRYFIFLDTESMQFEALENPNLDSPGGAGIRSGQLMADKAVRAVLTGNVGPNAYQVLSAAGIEALTGVSGKVSEAVENYKLGRYKPVSQPSVGSKFGMQGKP